METIYKVSNPGSTPVYNYRGHVIVNSTGTKWGRGWIYAIGPVTHFAPNLGSAKLHIDTELNK